MVVVSEAMYPVRKELVGKRFAFIRSEGRSGTRFRGATRAGGNQNFDEFNWITGTIVASNIEVIDSIKDSVVSRKVKVSLNHPVHCQHCVLAALDEPQSRRSLGRHVVLEVARWQRFGEAGRITLPSLAWYPILNLQKGLNCKFTMLLAYFASQLVSNIAHNSWSIGKSGNICSVGIYQNTSEMC